MEISTPRHSNPKAAMWTPLNKGARWLKLDIKHGTVMPVKEKAHGFGFTTTSDLRLGNILLLGNISTEQHLENLELLTAFPKILQCFVSKMNATRDIQEVEITAGCSQVFDTGISHL